MRGHMLWKVLVVAWTGLVVLGVTSGGSLLNAEARLPRMTSNLDRSTVKNQLRSLKSLTYDNHSRYEWGRGYDVTMEPGEIKAICFDEGSTFCIEYTFLSSLPTIALVADQKWTIGALDGAKKIRYIGGSVCSGVNCTEVQVTVPHRTSYCVLFMNRNNTIPDFSQSINATIDLQFVVEGCTARAHFVLYIIVFLISMLALMGCCLGAFFHFFRKVRALAQQNQQLSNAQLGLGDQSDSAAAQPAGRCQVVFMEAKV